MEARRRNECMSNNISKAVLRALREDYEKACNGYLVTLLNMWELDAYYGFWVADEVGGTYSYGDTGLYLNMDDMIYVVENQFSEQSYREWHEYCLWACEFNQTVPTLRAWHNGFVRVDEATQKKLSDMKRELNKLIEETKEKF